MTSPILLILGILLGFYLAGKINWPGGLRLRGRS